MLCMKRWIPYFLIPMLATSALAGNFFSPSPWANGAYYPGQLDGKYSATVFGNNTSGVLGFALQAGAPTTVTNSQANLTNSIVQNTIQVDPFQNYWLIFFNGVSYAGAMLGSVNVSSKQVSGGFFTGVGFVNPTTPALASGGFTATLTSDKSPITFTGNNTGRLAVSGGGASTTFSLNGIKVSNIASQ